MCDIKALIPEDNFSLYEKLQDRVGPDTRVKTTEYQTWFVCLVVDTVARPYFSFADVTVHSFCLMKPLPYMVLWIGKCLNFLEQIPESLSPSTFVNHIAMALKSIYRLFISIIGMATFGLVTPDTIYWSYVQVKELLPKNIFPQATTTVP